MRTCDTESVCLSTYKQWLAVINKATSEGDSFAYYTHKWSTDVMCTCSILAYTLPYPSPIMLLCPVNIDTKVYDLQIRAPRSDLAVTGAPTV